MGRPVKVIIGLALAVAAVLYVVFEHSEARQELVCKGYWKDSPSESETAYVQLNEYRWWVRLWSNNQGNLLVQTDTRPLTDFISDLRRTFDGRLAFYQFYDYDFGSGKLGKFRGGYRAANNEITIEFLPEAIFIGTCDGPLSR